MTATFQGSMALANVDSATLMFRPLLPVKPSRIGALSSYTGVTRRGDRQHREPVNLLGT